jgi:uncharacterized protein YegL
MDVVFVVDDTGSMGPAINNVKAGLQPIINTIETASGGDYRLALVTFKDDITVRATFAANNAATNEPIIMGLFAGGGNATEARRGAHSGERLLQQGALRIRILPWPPGALKLVI